MTMHIAAASLAEVWEEQAALVDMIPAVEKVDRIFPGQGAMETFCATTLRK